MFAINVSSLSSQYENIGFNAFDCFTVSDYLESALKYIDSDEIESLNTAFQFFGVALVAAISINIIVLFAKFRSLYKNYLEKKINFSTYRAESYPIWGNVILVAFVIIAKIAANSVIKSSLEDMFSGFGSSFSSNYSDLISLGTPTIIIIVIICAQIVINFIVKRIPAPKSALASNSASAETIGNAQQSGNSVKWECPNCYETNDFYLSRCHYCDAKKPSFAYKWLDNNQSSSKMSVTSHTTALEEDNKGEWVCDCCHRPNGMSLMSCKYCNEPRPKKPYIWYK